MSLKKFDSIVGRWRLLPRRHRYTIIILIAMIGGAMIWPSSSSLSGEVPLSLNSSDQPLVGGTQKSAHRPHRQPLIPDSEYTVVKDDTLGSIFNKLGYSQQQMYRVVENDQNQALDTINPGDRLRFWSGKNHQLKRFQVYFNPGYYVDFKLLDDGSYESREVRLEGTWKRRVVHGKIEGSLYLSARQLGLTPAQIEQIGQMFKDKINFAHLRAGDPFSIVIEDQFVEGQPTHESNLLAVQIISRKRQYNAFLFKNGKYYDERGQSLTRAFLRYPTHRHYRISSPFNLKRRHPVTGRISPHYGTDFACPTGTRVYATGEGVVTRVINHPYAGLYIVIRHGSTYKTRYLHLSKSYVHRGEPVKKGQLIARSGATGRVTGPHLHYEFRINNRPVNPMSTKIPMASAVSKKELPVFNKKVKKLLALMDPTPSS